MRLEGEVEVIPYWSTRLKVERLNRGLPLITADPNGWDDGFTLNPTAIRLERSPENEQIIQGLVGKEASANPKLNDGVVVVFYRGIPTEKLGLPALRSSVGLAVFTPELELIKRFPYPVVIPTDDPMGYDYGGVEDQRITRIGDTFYMVYCGYNSNYPISHNIYICIAESTDLIHWKKLGPVEGSVNDYPNKDAVIMSEKINGKYMMLHRPCVGSQGTLSIALAASDSPLGPWDNIGTIIKPVKHPRYATSWVGAGSTPLPLGDNRFLVDYHTGNYYTNGERDYFASYAILDFDKFDEANPEAIVESRCEGILEPETPYELNSPWPHKNTLNCIFPCGSYEHKDDIMLIYGGTDAYVLAAKLNKDELLQTLDTQNCRYVPVVQSLPKRAFNRLSNHYSKIRQARRVSAG